MFIVRETLRAADRFMRYGIRDNIAGGLEACYGINEDHPHLSYTEMPDSQEIAQLTGGQPELMAALYNSLGNESEVPALDELQTERASRRIGAAYMLHNFSLAFSAQRERQGDADRPFVRVSADAIFLSLYDPMFRNSFGWPSAFEQTEEVMRVMSHREPVYELAGHAAMSLAEQDDQVTDGLGGRFNRNNATSAAFFTGVGIIEQAGVDEYLARRSD